jgi:NAD(P)-dependent dehydrogenase (short-subunit alcohol dehydrogenase family)
MSAIGLSGKRVVITGAARGLGRAYAEACCAAGATVAVADILEKEGHDTAESLRGKGHEAFFVPVDLADAQSVEAMGETLGKEWGRIDGLVNNGALATKLGGKRFENIDIAVWDQVMAVNVRGVWLATKACLPWIRNTARS